jgi:cytochrome P450
MRYDVTTSMTLDEELTRFFSARPESIAWPYPMYRRWQQGSGAVDWVSGPALVLTRYADVKLVMSGALPLGNNAYRYGRLAEGTLSRLPQELHSQFFEILDFESLFMSRKDGEEHARLRKIAARAFTARRVAMLRASIEHHVDELMSGIVAEGTSDWKTKLANLLPTRVITDLIGVPQSDREMIWQWSEAVAAFFSIDPVTLQQAQDAVSAFRAYVGDMIAHIRRTGEGPELAKLLLAGHADEAMTEDELVAMYLLLLFGGSETTTNLLGNGFLALQRNRDQWDRLVADPALVPNAVEEVFRYDAPHHYLPRYALEDFEIAGHQVAKNDTVIVVHGAANRDESIFPDPDVLDIGRKNAREHLSLAFGPHYCLGAALARLEGQVVFDRLVRQLPEARLITDDIRYGGSALLRAIQSLPMDTGRPAF